MSAVTPIFVSVKETARLLDITPWSVYQLINAGLIDAQYQGKRRSIRYESVVAYADSLPRERESGAVRTGSAPAV